ncbi:MAG TPA: 23S rRNA (pseudouridine(1915)-N(3))-methyltransferase RlmH [Chthoniobacteraceae bacterium]
MLAIGKPKLDFARSGIEEYAGRLQSFAPLKLEYLKSGTQFAESAGLAERSQGSFRIVLDERGEHPTSRELARKLDQWEQRSVKEAALIIGGADGHTRELRDSADWLWSLSHLTLQHELALVVALEQIYRAYSIKAGLPYHRD